MAASHPRLFLHFLSDSSTPTTVRSAKGGWAAGPSSPRPLGRAPDPPARPVPGRHTRPARARCWAAAGPSGCHLATGPPPPMAPSTRPPAAPCRYGGGGGAWGDSTVRGPWKCICGHTKPGNLPISVAETWKAGRDLFCLVITHSMHLLCQLILQRGGPCCRQQYLTLPYAYCTVLIQFHFRTPGCSKSIKIVKYVPDCFTTARKTRILTLTSVSKGVKGRVVNMIFCRWCCF